MRKILYKKYIKEKDSLKIESRLVTILYGKYYESLDSQNGLILNENHIAYLQGISDAADIALDCYGNYFKKVKEEVDNLISYIHNNKEVKVWSCFENE